MNGIAGFCNVHLDLRNNSNLSILEKMRKSISHRGIISSNYFCNHESYDELLMDGNVFNKEYLKGEQKSDSEIMFNGIREQGIDFLNKVNGTFAGAFWNKNEQTLYLFRDQLGVKPLFYTVKNDTLVFASEMKALFKFPEIEAIVDEVGLCEIFGVGPARTENLGVFKNIYSVRPGHFAIWNKDGFKEIKYWDLDSKDHKDDYETTLDTTSTLLKEAVKCRTRTSSNICSLLSGGIDSSLVSAIAKIDLEERGMKQLDTYSFEYTDNEKYFKANAFQPESDSPWAAKMAEYLKSNQRVLVCDPSNLKDLLKDAMIARDLPGMGDIDSSLLYFCGLIKNNNDTALTGECADEVFGGYPWFHKEELLSSDTFPWSRDVEVRKMILNEDMNKKLNIGDYARNRYDETIKNVPLLDSDDSFSKRKREINYLTIKWFMMTLVDRMDRMASYKGLGARVPFADINLVEYVWNVPWSMKVKDDVVKSLLRESSKGLLPDEILFRKKSPFPKTYNPNYEKLLIDELEEILKDKSSPILQFVDESKIKILTESPSNYGKPWYGQLMAGPQQLAYLIQINQWFKHYKVKVEI